MKIKKNNLISFNPYSFLFNLMDSVDLEHLRVTDHNNMNQVLDFLKTPYLNIKNNLDVFYKKSQETNGYSEYYEDYDFFTKIIKNLKTASSLDLYKIPSQLVLHIPHASTYIPTFAKKEILLSESQIEDEINKMTDIFTESIFLSRENDFNCAVFPLSRLAVDPERFIDDDIEIMSTKGMGVIYTKTSDGKDLRKKVTMRQKEKLLNYYHRHHKDFSLMVKRSYNTFGSSLIIDCHSFPSIALPYELDQDSVRPDICLGTDPYHTPEKLTGFITEYFQDLGFTVATNKPFNGTIVPMQFYKNVKKVSSIMIEVNRKLYTNENSASRVNLDLIKMRDIIANLFKEKRLIDFI